MQVVEQVSHVQTDLKEELGQALLSAFRQLARSGLLGASQVDISVRVPGGVGALATPPRSIVEELSRDDLLEVTMGGRIVHRRGRVSFSTQMHLAIYRSRENVNAVVHAHAPMATILGICSLPIPPITVDTVPFWDLPRVPLAGLHDSQWADTVARGLGSEAPAALLLNHGMIVVGSTLQEAARRALSLEETARILVFCQLLQQAPGTIGAEATDILKRAGI